MEAVLTAAEMSKLDETTITYFRVPPEVLMERAALSVADIIAKEELDTGDVLVICGGGNNGGDGFAIARILTERGINSHILYTGKNDPASMSRESRLQKEICYKYEVPMEKPEDFDWASDGSTLIIDAMFGIGLNRPLDEKNINIVKKINEAGAGILRCGFERCKRAVNIVPIRGQNRLTGRGFRFAARAMEHAVYFVLSEYFIKAKRIAYVYLIERRERAGNLPYSHRD